MTLITKQERQAILDRFPKAEIVSSRHRYYLVGYNNSNPDRLLKTMRGITPSPSRKDKAHNGDRNDKSRR